MIYVGGRGNEHAEIMFVGEAIGLDEERLGECFVGASGKELIKIIQEVGINPTQCWFTNVIRHRPPTNQQGKLDLSGWISALKKDSPGKTFFFGHYVSDLLLQHLDDLRREIEIIKPKVIVALGNVAMAMLTGKSGVTAWRGSELWLDLPNCEHKCHVVPTFNPAFIYGNWPARRLIRRDLQRANGLIGQEKKYESNWTFLLRPSFEEINRYLDNLRRELDADLTRTIAVDIETRRGQIACIGIAESKQRAVCIPFLCVERPMGYFNFDEEVEVVRLLEKILTHKNVRVIGHNFHYDQSYIAKCWGFRANVWHDTMIRWHTLFTRWEKSLSFVCSILSEHYVYWKDDGKEWDSSVPEEQYWAYNCTDCVRTFEADELIEQSLAKINLTVQADFEQSLFLPVEKMMFRGVLQDVEKKKTISKELGEEIKKRLGFLENSFGFPVNPNSPKQMKALFYDDLKQKKIYHRKTG